MQNMQCAKCKETFDESDSEESYEWVDDAHDRGQVKRFFNCCPHCGSSDISAVETDDEDDTVMGLADQMMAIISGYEAVK